MVRDREGFHRDTASPMALSALSVSPLGSLRCPPGLLQGLKSSSFRVSNRAPAGSQIGLLQGLRLGSCRVSNQDSFRVSNGAPAGSQIGLLEGLRLGFWRVSDRGSSPAAPLSSPAPVQDATGQR